MTHLGTCSQVSHSAIHDHSLHATQLQSGSHDVAEYRCPEVVGRCLDENHRVRGDQVRPILARGYVTIDWDPVNAIVRWPLPKALGRVEDGTDRGHQSMVSLSPIRNGSDIGQMTCKRQVQGHQGVRDLDESFSADLETTLQEGRKDTYITGRVFLSHQFANRFQFVSHGEVAGVSALSEAGFSCSDSLFLTWPSSGSMLAEISTGITYIFCESLLGRFDFRNEITVQHFATTSS